MPQLKINSDGPFLPPGARRDLRRALRDTPRDAPVIICVHGFKFSPKIPRHDPHDHILALDPGSPCRKARSWPRALGFGSGTAKEGLCIGLGWEARGSIWQAYARARQTGEALARLIWKLDRPVQVIGHSLGARVILSALPHLPAGTVERAVLLAAAEFRSTALHALDSEAGRAAQILNVTSRENDLFDLMVELALRPDHGPSRSLGSGLGEIRRGWCDMQIDDPATRAAFRHLGHDIPAPDRRICHWSPYLRDGLFEIYRTVLRHPERLPIPLLQELLPQPAERGHTRFLSALSRPAPLPFSRNASS
ncbi:DUF726 domain-containing protein [Celeribacter neptunius]|uniref:Alpha/beta hydrolase family protein n=1 Tax=Celeribacter neptunius TaxID=588602 RepID=A0A1I3J259_9RHOB|nr:DUF726 domain-containing protein [Celeribacter neptunius]SFI54290.1 Protein of unknown function [Celeribacter neptunius]